MEQSLLFRLPRELRDEIYKYALYHAGGLLYTIGKNGAGRLSRKTRNVSSRKSVLTTFYDRSCRVVKAQAKRHGIDYNQLKHVCRQLRDESSALIPHGNVVFTRGSSTMNAFEQCLILFEQFPKVRSVAIKCCTSFASESSQGKLFETIQRCAGHARVSVRIHIPHWCLADPDFVFRGIFYLYSLRNDATLVSRLAKVSPVTYLSNSASDILTVDRPIPGNVRFYPWDVAYDSQLVDQIRQKKPLLDHPLTRAAIGNIGNLARAWIEKGL